MPGLGSLGKILIITGIVIVVLGLIIVFWNRIPFFGKLPGDIHIERGDFRFYFPITTGLIISAGLTVIINLVLLVLRLFNK